MPKLRIWHYARDAYHCAFRMLSIMDRVDAHEMPFERLRLLDLFLLYPPLLYRVKLPDAMRQTLNASEIPRPDEVFIELPSSAAIFQDLRVYQNAALSLLVAKGIFDRGVLKDGVTHFTPEALPPELTAEIAKRRPEVRVVLDFLVNDIAQLPLAGTNSVYRRAALPHRALSA